MRILVVSHMFPSSFNPDDVFIFNQTKALVEQGVEVRVLQPIPWAPWPLWYREKWKRYHLVARETGWGGLAIRRVPYLNPPMEGLQPLAPLCLMAPLQRALKEIRSAFDFDLIHAHTITPDGFAAVRAGREMAKPVVISARGSDVHTYPRRNRWLARETRQALSQCSRVVAVSRELARQTEALAPGCQSVEVVYNGVDAGLFAPGADQSEVRAALKLPIQGTLALAVGALVPEKGFADLIKAVERTSRDHSELRLVVVGAGSMQAELAALGARLGPGRVLLPGAVPNSKVADYMRAADLLLHPSHAEGLPNVVLEAMAAELPVIATSVGGIPEVVIPGETGWLFSARDDQALEVHLRNLLANPGQRREMGRAGRRRILERHSWARNAQEHIRIYRNILENP